jgi:hypothetical protein
MRVKFKIFHEKTDSDYEKYSKLWDENKERFIFLHTHLSASHQMIIIKNDMDNNKDILAVCFPTINDIRYNKIINNVVFGKGIRYDNYKIWYPTEVWIYNVKLI